MIYNETKPKEINMENFKCPLCSKEANQTEWNNSTLKLCINREMKRKYIPFESSFEKHRKSNTSYNCPNCEKMVNRFLIKENK